MIQKKISGINVKEELDKIEKEFTTHQEKIYSTYKILGSDSKSTSLTYSTKFNELLKDIQKENKDCEVLNTLLRDKGLKIKSSYLTNNNINAFGLGKSESGDVCLSYTDMKKDLAKELRALKSRSTYKKGEFSEHVKATLNNLERNFPWVYDVSYATKENKVKLFNNLATRNTISKAASNLKTLHSTHLVSLMYTPNNDGMLRPTERFPHTLTYLLNYGSTALVANSVQFMLRNLFRYMRYIFDDKDLDSATKAVSEELQKWLIENLIDSNIMQRLLEDLVNYYEKSMKGLIVLSDNAEKYSVKDFTDQIEVQNEENLINTLALSESALNFLNVLLKGGQINYLFAGNNRSLFYILRTRGVLNYDFDMLAQTLNVTKYFTKYGLYNTSNYLFYDLGNKHRRFLQNLYKPQYRENCKIGKISSKLFNDHYSATDIEKFTSLFKKYTLTKSTQSDIRIIEGSLITYYYNYLAYTRGVSPKASLIDEPVVGEQQNAMIIQDAANQNGGGGSLHSSCMKGAGSYNGLRTYSRNPETIKMLAAFDKEKKLKARAILWYKDDKIYIDRVYACNEAGRLEMYAWAEKRGYISVNNTNGSYNQKLRLDRNYEGVLLSLKHSINSIPYFDSARRAANSGIITIGNVPSIEVEKAVTKLELSRAKEEKGSVKAFSHINLVNADVVSSCRKEYVKKTYEFSKEYDFDIESSLKEVSEAEGYYRRTSLSFFSRCLSMGDSVTNDLLLNLRQKTSRNKLAPIVPEAPRTVKQEDVEYWTNLRAKHYIEKMKFLGGINFKSK